MKYIDEYRDEGDARRLIEAIGGALTRPRTLMEICGGQTHTLVKSGIDRMLPEEISVVHGPGCPVCVTPLELIEKAIHIARRPEVIFTSFGDMLRVPGSDSDLLGIKAQGGDVRMVYSPLDAVGLAQANPDREVVFFAVGFETTAPANAMAVWQAHQLGLKNFSILCSHVLVPPAMCAVLDAPDNRVEGFLAAGHVCTVMGYREYEVLSREFGVPFVVGGFEPVDLLEAVSMLVDQLEGGGIGVENQYARVVPYDGNLAALQVMSEVFELRPHFEWRGLGFISQSGLKLSDAYADFDAELRYASKSA